MDVPESPESLPAFQAMRVAAIGRPERSMGDSVIPAEPPRWSEVREHARALASAPTHLEVLTTLVRAGLALDGPRGLAASLDALAGALEADWATLYPVADEDDPDEPWYERSNLLADLVADPVFGDALARAPLVEVRGIGTFSARDIDIADGSVEGSEEDRARCQSGLIDAAFAEADVDALGATRTALDAAHLATERAVAVLERLVGAGGGRALAELDGRLAALRTRFERRAAERLGADAADEHAANDAAAGPDADGGPGVGASAGGTAPATRAAPASTTLADHDAVHAALAAVGAYYARHEPGSPVAVLVARARSLVGRGFFDLLGTLCPEGEAGGDFAARLAAPPRDPLLVLLGAGFGGHLAGESEPFEPTPEPDTSVDEDAPDGSDGDLGAPGGTVAAPAVATRDAVLGALDDVLAFYRVHEPSSPVPLVLARVRTLVPLDFDGVLDTLRRALAADAAAAIAQTEDA